MRSVRKAAFLDRDGVINHDYAYIGNAGSFSLIDGVVEALRQLRAAGYALVVVTNQSGIGRGYFSEQDYRAVTAEMERQLGSHGLYLDAVFHCPHAPASDCSCRKPRPGLILEAATALSIDLSASVLFGDKETDIQAGRAAGVRRCYLIRADLASSADVDGQAADLLSCVRLLFDTHAKGREIGA